MGNIQQPTSNAQNPSDQRRQPVERVSMPRRSFGVGSRWEFPLVRDKNVFAVTIWVGGLAAGGWGRKFRRDFGAGSWKIIGTL